MQNTKMEIITNTLEFQLDRDTAVAMGKFDGLHIGHRKLLDLVLRQRDQRLAPVFLLLIPLPQYFSVSLTGGN